MVAALADAPAIAFTDETARMAMLRWEWLPSAADAHRFVEEVVAPFRAMLRGLDAVERAPLPTGPGRERPRDPDPPAIRSPEEVEAVRAKAAAFVAEVRAREVTERASRPLSVAARPLTPQEMIAQLEYEIRMAGGPGCRPGLDFRLEVERRKVTGSDRAPTQLRAVRERDPEAVL
jgi:hypothetical protein